MHRALDPIINRIHKRRFARQDESLLTLENVIRNEAQLNLIILLRKFAKKPKISLYSHIDGGSASGGHTVAPLLATPGIHTQNLSCIDL